MIGWLRPSVVAVAACGTVFLGAPPRLPAQSVPLAEQPQEPPPAVTGPISPGGAFLRSLAIPGWGQAASGSYERAGFYFLTSAATGWMLFKTGHSLGAARDREDLIRGEAEAALRRDGITDPDSLRVLIEQDPRVQQIEGLVESRSQQMEDWTAFGVFWLLLNAADAFVSAHLANFPEPVEVEFGGGFSGAPARIELSIPFGP